MKNLKSKWTTEENITNWTQEIEERPSGVEYTIEEIDISVKKNVPSKTTTDKKHPGNMGLYKKAKTKNNMNRGRRRKTGQKHQIYFQKNLRRKFPLPKEVNVFQSTRSILNTKWTGPEKKVYLAKNN